MYRDYTNIPVDLLNKTTAQRIIDFIQSVVPDCYLPDNFFYIRRRLALALIGLKLSMADIEEKLNNNNKELADQLLSFVFNDHTELFRETDAWIMLKESVLGKMSDTCSICIPYSINGEELYSLLILLNEYFSDKKPTVTVTGISDYALHKISEGVMTQPKIRSSLLNLKHVCENTDFTKYTVKVNNVTRFNSEFLNKVKFENELKDRNESRYDLVLCRNKSLNMTQDDTSEFHFQIQQKVNINGYLFLGTSENLDKKSFDKFRVVSWNEKIFQREKE